jgi:hypothetical protein
MTVRRAFGELEDDELVEPRHGSGTYVRPRRLEQTIDRVIGFTDEARHLGFRPGARLLEFGPVQADADVAEALRCAVGDKVLRIARLRTADDAPLSLQHAYLRPSLLALEVADLERDGSLYRTLERRFGVVPQRARQTISARLPQRRERTCWRSARSIPCWRWSAPPSTPTTSRSSTSAPPTVAIVTASPSTCGRRKGRERHPHRPARPRTTARRSPSSGATPAWPATPSGPPPGAPGGRRPTPTPGSPGGRSRDTRGARDCSAHCWPARRSAPGRRTTSATSRCSPSPRASAATASALPLWDAATAALRARGRRRLRIGADPERLLPGVPLTAPEATWRFLRARGIRPGGLEADLRLDLAHGAIDATRCPTGSSASTTTPRLPSASSGAPSRALGRRGRARRGGRHRRPRPAARGHHARLLPRPTADRRGSRSGAHLDGARPLGPARPDHRWAGPAGDRRCRPRGGLGLALVAASARWLRDHGLRAAVIDWTTLTAFYGRLGARAWRVYQRAEGEL